MLNRLGGGCARATATLKMPFEHGNVNDPETASVRRRANGLRDGHLQVRVVTPPGEHVDIDLLYPNSALDTLMLGPYSDNAER